MTELKYLEEVLPAYRAGKTIGRKEFNRVFYYNINAKATDRPVTYTLNELCSPTAISEKVWFIVPNLVSWPKAWEALKAGKKIRIDSIVYHAQIHIPGGTVKKQLCLYYEDPKNFGNETCMGHNIPISWLDREDFEVYDQ